MSFVIVDVEADGPIPADFSMVCFGAVLFDEQLGTSFYGRTRPISDRFIPEALAVSGFSREEHLTFDDPKTVMERFAAWLDQHSQGRPVFVSDNLAFDWQFINYYFHRFLGRNPFGFSGRRIGDLYAGLVKDARALVKVLGGGELSKPLTVAAHHFSASARQKIEAAGGAVKELG